MAEWRSIVEQRLGHLPLPPARREQILQELSEHLEDEFAALRERLSEDEAERETLNLLAESDALAREIRRAEQEDVMNQTIRIFLCGIATGAILFLLGLVVFVFALGGTDFAAAVDAARATGHPAFPPLPALLHVAAGIWTMWLYAALRPRYGPGPKTAMMTGFALWVICTLVDTRWVSMGLTPLPLTSFLAPLSAGLPVAIVAAVAGAWTFERGERAPSRALKVT